MPKKTHRPFKREYLLVPLAMLTVGIGGFFIWISTFNIPNLDAFEQRKVQESTKIYDRTGEVVLYDVFENIKRTIVPLEEISDHVKNATISIEDKDFYRHSGIQLSSIMRAVFVNVRDQEFSQGGSTITQQVIKNALLTPDKLISRKVKEWVLALRLERIMEKDDILSIYLNEIPYGGTIYGVEEASRSFFNKRASELTIAESAYLAALPKAPTHLSPFGNNREALEARKNLVLNRMLEYKFITQYEHAEAVEEEVVFYSRDDGGIKAPWFVMYVRDQLERKYGEGVLEQQGYRIITTLDYDLQKEAEEIVRRRALQNAESFNAENGSIVAVDPQSGHVLVMVGSRGYSDPDIQGQFNITTSKRQPGSSFKPIVYANALNKGYTPETVVFDLHTQFSTSCAPENLTTTEECYAPNNYDLMFRGPVTFRNALAQSMNIPAIKTLYLGGADDVLKLARDLGITSLTGSRHDYGLPLALGAGEVSPLELAGAYSVFAAEGERRDIMSIIRIEDNRGNVLEEFESEARRVLPRQTAAQITDMLSDNVARTPAFGANSLLHVPGYDVAVKTGTTNEYVDAWIVGYTPKIAVAAWAGNNDSRPMVRRTAGFIVAPMWRDFMDIALAEGHHQAFQKPEPVDTLELKPILRGVWQGGESYTIDTRTGEPAGEDTPEEYRDVRYVMNVHSILYWVDRTDPRGPRPQRPERDSQFYHWEYPVRMWARGQQIWSEDDPQSDIDNRDNDDDDRDGTGSPLRIRIRDIRGTYDVNDEMRLRIESEGPYPLTRTEVYLNGGLVATSESSPFVFSLKLSDFSHIEETNIVRVMGYDSGSNIGESSHSFKIRNLDD
jgi:1A family penicillin-binding protein